MTKPGSGSGHFKGVAVGPFADGLRTVAAGFISALQPGRIERPGFVHRWQSITMVVPVPKPEIDT